MATSGRDRRREAVGPGIEMQGGAGLGLPQPGTRIGQYELIRELGRGGMGAVYLARDTRLGRRVAIKFLHSANPEITARFLLEARATARCSHENIVVIHEVGESGDRPFMVLEYLQGAPLGKQLRDGRKIPPGRAIELVVPVVRALVRAHEHNIVHRDLKPDNIFVTDSGTVKVLDFGIAKLVQGEYGGPSWPPAGLPVGRDGHPAVAGPTLATPAGAVDDWGGLHRGSYDSTNPSSGVVTRRGALVGTLPYMSPEQWGADEVDHRTDIWAVGIILFRMVAGKHPLAPRAGRELMVTGILSKPMPRVRSVCPEISDELAAVIDRCLIKPKNQRMASAKLLLDALEPLLPGRYTRRLRVDQSPYAGLSSFQEADADRFFGRAREVAAVTARLRDQPLLGIVGPSGVGKSSFVRAGVVPALKQSGEAWVARVVRPGRQPLAALARVVAPMLSESSSIDVAGTVEGDLSEVQSVIARLAAEPGFLGSVLRSRARRGVEKILLFIDQFEELYTLCGDSAERLAFTTCLACAADDATTPLRVVISIRSDFLDRVPEDGHFMAELSSGLFFLTPPNRAGLRDALIQPAEMAGYQYESPAMVEHMLDHLENTPGALPLLQFAASKLWDARDSEQKLLSEDSYHAFGGIAGALASHADSVLAEFPSADQQLVRIFFLRLVTPERTRAVVSMGELHELAPDPGNVQRLIDHLVRARLLVVQTGDAGSGASVEIVHESLIHSWPMLRRWLDENQDDAQFLEQLRTAAKQWQAKNYPNGLLWRGEAMEEANRFCRRYRGDVPELQKAYLQAVFALAARSNRRKRLAIAGTIGILSLLVAAAAVALVLIGNAQKKAEREATRAVAAEKKAIERLAEVEKKERERKQEEKLKVAAEGKANEAARQLERTNDDLVRSNADLAQALKKAKRSRRKARKARDLAREQEEAARRAEAEERKANERLQRLLAREKARADRLAAKGTLLIEDVAVKKAGAKRSPPRGGKGPGGSRSSNRSEDRDGLEESP